MVLINFYKIVSSNTDKVYIGSTGKTLNERLSGHKHEYKKFQERKTDYTSSFEILEFKDYSIQLIESKECETKQNRGIIEGYHILNNPTAVNKYMPGRTKQQWISENKQQTSEYQKRYYQNNREYVKNRVKQQYQNIKEHLNEKHICQCGKIYSTHHKTRHEKSQKHINYIHIHP